MVGLEGGRIRLIGCRGLEGRGLGCRGLGCRGACGALFVFWWVGFAGRARSDEHSRGRWERAVAAMVGWVWWLVVGCGRGRWSVRGGVPTLERGNDQKGSARSARGNDRRSKWCARRTLRWPGVGWRGQWGGVEQGRGVGQTGTARQRRLPGRVGRCGQAGRSGLGFAPTGHGGQTGQAGAEEQHGGGFGYGSSRT